MEAEKAWTPIITCQELTQSVGAPSARSSHAIAVVDKKAYVFGGEFEPRVPIDNKIHVFDLYTHTWSVADAKGEVPSARVGVAMVACGSIIYIFGGRDEQHEELSEFYSFNTRSGEWTLLSADDSSPPHRSYHALSVDEESKNIYTFGGCGKCGRLNDFWVFNIDSAAWKQLPQSKECVARGGAGLAVVNGGVWVIFGFSGSERDDIHRFDIHSQHWEEVKLPSGSNKPKGRSVFGSACLENKNILIYGGEIDPSDKGHLGAGAFTNEALVFDSEKMIWCEKNEMNIKVGRHPGARGWFSFSAFGNSMLIYGGNSESNDRLDDIFLLTVESG